MFKRLKSALTALSLVINVFPIQINAQSVYNGNYKGHLILCGGVNFPKEAVEKFVEFAGGSNANFIFVASASTSIRLDNGYIYDIPDKESDSAVLRRQEFEKELSKIFGVARISVIDTRNKNEANPPITYCNLRKQMVFG